MIVHVLGGAPRAQRGRGNFAPHEVAIKGSQWRKVGGTTEAQIRQVILVAYWLNIGTILVQCRPISVQYSLANIGPISVYIGLYWLILANIGPTLANFSLQYWSNIVTNIGPTLGRNNGRISCPTWD